MADTRTPPPADDSPFAKATRSANLASLHKKLTGEVTGANMLNVALAPIEAIKATVSSVAHHYVQNLEHTRHEVNANFAHDLATQAPDPLADAEGVVLGAGQTAANAVGYIASRPVGPAVALFEGADAGLKAQAKFQSKFEFLGPKWQHNPGADVWNFLWPMTAGVTDFTKAISQEDVDEGLKFGPAWTFVHQAADALGFALTGRAMGGKTARPKAADVKFEPASDAASVGGKRAPVSDVDAQLQKDLSKAAEFPGARDAVDAVMGKTRSGGVTFLRDVDDLPPGISERSSRIYRGKKLLGLATREGKFYVFTRHANTPALVAWTAVHEVGGHGGINALIESHPEVRLGALPIADAYRNLRASVLSNATVRSLSQAIGNTRRPEDWNSLNFGQRETFHLKMGEEAMAELQAAKRTGNWDELGKKYGVTMTDAFKSSASTGLSKYVAGVKQILNAIYAHISGKSADAFTDRDVHDMLDRMWEMSERGKTAGAEEMASEDKLTPEEEAKLKANLASAANNAETNDRISAAKSAQDQSEGWEEAVAANAKGDEWVNAHAPKDENGEALPPEQRFPTLAKYLGNAAAANAAHVADHLFDDMDTLSSEIPNRSGKRPPTQGHEGLHGNPKTIAERQVAALASGHAAMDYGSLVQTWKRRWVSLRDFMRRNFPNVTLPQVERATSSMIRHMATTDFEHSRAHAVLSGLSLKLASLTLDQHQAVWDFMELGTALPDDFPIHLDWASIRSYLQTLGQRFVDTETGARGFRPYKLKKNYGPRYGRSPENVPYDTTLDAPTHEAFERQQQFHSMREMREAGVQPLSMNYADHWIARLEANRRYVNRWTVLRDALDQGDAHVVPEDYRPTPDETLVRSPDHGAVIAMPHTLAAAMHNTVLAKPWDAEARRVSTMLKLGAWKSAQALPILAYSLFHPFHIEFYVSRVHAMLSALSMMGNPLTPAGIADFAEALSRMVTGPIGTPRFRGARIRAGAVMAAARGKGATRFNPKSGAVEHSTGDPTWGIVDISRGRKSLSEINSAEAEGLRLLNVAGADIGGSSEWNNRVWTRMRAAFAEQTKTGYLKGMGWSVPASIRATMSPVMNYYVPWMKTRALLDDYDHWIKKNPEARGSDSERLFLTRQWREISERFGEMNTRNLMWSRWFTAMFQGSMLSFGWNMGLVSQFGGGPRDVGGAIARMARGQAIGNFRSRLAYSAMYLAYGCGIGYLTTKFLGKTEPKSIMDCVYPIVGHDDAGNPVRVSQPWLGKDIAAMVLRSRYEGPLSAVAETALDKGAPLFSMAHDLLRNENFFGQQIIEPGDPLWMQAGQAFRFIGESETPISAQNIAQNNMDLAGHGKALGDFLNVLGFNKAPAYAVNDPWVNKIRWMAQSQHLEGATPYANAQKDNAMYDRHLSQLFQHMQATGDSSGFFQAWNKFRHDFHLTDRQAKTELARMAAPKYAMTLRELPQHDQVMLWNQASPEQRKAYYKYFSQIVRAGMAPGQTPP